MNIHRRSSCRGGWLWENYLTRHSAVRLPTSLFMNAAAANLCGLSVVGSDETALSPSCSQRLALSHPIPQRHAQDHVTTHCSVPDTATHYFKTPKKTSLNSLKSSLLSLHDFFLQKTKGCFSYVPVLANLFGIEKHTSYTNIWANPKIELPL